MPFYDAIRIGAAAAGDFEVERSLRFNGADGAFLERTPSSSSNKRTMTFSFWFKRAVDTNFTTVFRSYGNASNRHGIDFVSGGQLRLWGNYNGSVAMTVQPTQVFRDFSAWYHFVLAIDTTQSTASNRVKMYINGDQITDFATASYPSQNFDFGFNDSNAETQIGTDGGTTCNFYLAEFHEIDGLQLTPSSFAETNAETGQWVPKNTAGLTFGTNGFRLKFADNSGTTATTLGKDSSGNGNNFTPNNFVTGDVVSDTPTNNFPTWNPISSKNIPTFFEGTLKNNGDNNTGCNATFGVTSGKWYWEMHILTDVSSSSYIAATGVTAYEMENDGDQTPRLNYDTTKRSWYRGMTSGGVYAYKRYTETNGTEISSGGTFYGGTVISFRLDMDNGSLKFYTNNTLVHTDTTIPTDGTVIFPMQNATNSGTTRHNSSIINFGQDGTFAGTKTAQGNTDSSGIGNFFYAVPSGFKAICSANLSDPTILLPNKHFEPLLYTGNGGTQSITGLEFQPDWVWIKKRNGTTNNLLYDAVRGATKEISSNLTAQEGNEPGSVSSFNSNGFSVGSNGGVNGNSDTFVAWNWNAGDAASKTYRVVVVSDSGNKYRFRNSANSATFAQSAVTLALEEGGTYTFDQSDSTMSSHPMKLSTTANGTHGGGSSYNTGVTYELDGSTVTESAFVSGFSSATSRKLIITVAASAPTLYYYCHYHSGMGGTADTFDTLGSSNFDGSVQSVVKPNTTAGFSIARWTIPSDAVYTIGHGLGVAPKVIFMKARNQTTNWDVFHTSAGNTKRLKLNSTSTQEDYTGPWNDTDPTSTVFTSTGSWLNGSGTNVIAYVFSEVAGFSKFGSYTGNGNADGPFVHLGFRPAFVLTKIIDTINENWTISDSKRSTFNAVDLFLRPDEATSDTSGAATMDFLSNGFKIRNTDDKTNRNGATFIFFAFAESPFKNSRAR